MYPQISHYMTNGRPATGLVTINRVPVGAGAGLTVTLDGTAYVWSPPGTSTAPTSLSFTGDTPQKMVQSLVAAINADPSRYGVDHWNNQPIKSIWAVYYGTSIRLIASEGGTGGNSLNISITTTTDAYSASISGATLANGAA